MILYCWVYLFVYLFVGSAGQVCRPHFHSPLHPWSLAESKPMVPHAHSGWINPFGKPLNHASPAPAGLSSVYHGSGTGSGSHSGSAGISTGSSTSHLFSFPPTPPKDSTPDMHGSGAATAGGAGAGTAGTHPGANPSHQQHQQHTPGTDGAGSEHSLSQQQQQQQQQVPQQHQPAPQQQHGQQPQEHNTSGGHHQEYSPGSKPPVKSEESAATMTSDVTTSSLSFIPCSSSSSSSAAYSCSPSPRVPSYPTYSHSSYMAPPPSDYPGSALFHPASVFKAATLARVRTKSRNSSGENGNDPSTHYVS